MLPGPSPIGGLRDAIADRVRALVGSGEIAIDRPPGDDGLFGPGSVAWRVHGDVTAMMIGGVSALLLQMLHPGALAGVWDHSDFRRDRLGRLRRTAQFIGLTTYGGTAQAEGVIARVRAIHDHVHGALPDGTPYSANDPALLTWVHVAEVDSFLRAWIAYREPALSGPEQDRYLGEVATIARRLGATDVPRTRREVDDYYRTVRPQLRVDARTREVADALLAPGDDAAVTAGMALLGRAGIDLLPPWAAALHGRRTAPLARPALRLATRGVGHTLRWALRRK